MKNINQTQIAVKLCPSCDDQKRFLVVHAQHVHFKLEEQDVVHFAQLISLSLK